MKKKALSLFLASVMLVSAFTGCGKEENNNGASSGGDGTTNTGGSESGVDGEPYEVAIQVVTLPGTEVAQEAEIEAAINEITLSAINCTVDVQYVWISEVANTTSLAIAGDEKVDLLHVATVSPLSSMVGSDMLYDMNTDNLLQTHGPQLVELMGDILESGNVSGKQLAVPAKFFNSSKKGIYYNKTAADEWNITVPETGSLDDLEKLVYQVKDAGSDMMPFTLGEGNSNYLFWLRGYDGFGADCAYGAIMNAESNLTVENFYQTEDFKNFCLRMQKWKADGILTKDPTDTTLPQDYFMAGQLFCVVADLNPETVANFSSTAAQNGIELGTMTMVDAKVSNSSVTEFMWGIASNSERPDKAMDFLNFLYSNAEVANLLRYGLEGSDYHFAEGSDRIIESTGSYSVPFYCGGNTRDMYILSPAEDDFIDQWEAQEESATISPIIGYMFHDGDFQTESSVIGSTIQQYLPGLQCGMYNSQEEVLTALDEFNAALEAAGINGVIAANQEQLDAYLASK